MSENNDILYEKSSDGLIVSITFNQPNILNSLDSKQYLKLGNFLTRANDDPHSIITLIKSTGKYFSSGANISKVAQFSLPKTNFNSLDEKYDHDEPRREEFLNSISSRNVWLTNIFNNHNKLLVSCINGPVIGLSASLVCLSDLIYCMNDKIFFLFPFSNLGLVNEGGISQSLINRIGLSKSIECLLLSKPIFAKELLNLGLVNSIYNYETKDINEFNLKIEKNLRFLIKDLDKLAILENKKLIRLKFDSDVESINSIEAINGLKKWVDGVPLLRSRELYSKKRKHKL